MILPTISRLAIDVLEGGEKKQKNPQKNETPLRVNTKVRGEGGKM